jgi:hypothetical protein
LAHQLIVQPTITLLGFPFPNPLRAVAKVGLLLLHLTKLNLHDRDNVFVGLLPALKLKKVVICATRAAGIFPTDAGASVIDLATACLLIQEHACLGVNNVFNALENALALPHLCVPALGRLEIYAEIFGEAVDVPLVDLDALVDRAAVCGALVAIVVKARLFLSHQVLK